MTVAEMHAGGGVPHVMSLDGAAPHTPPAQVPGPLYTRRVTPSRQIGAGVAQLTPEHGSPAHPFAVALHPNVHDEEPGA